MQENTNTKQYLNAICNQIRYKKIHKEICDEIENHINDQKEAFKVQGIDEETAALKAIEQMGDPVLVGTELDRIHKPKPEWSIIALTFLLLCTGIIIRFFTSTQNVNSLELFYRQVIFTIVGIGLAAICYYIDFTVISKYPKTIFLVLAAVIIMMIIISRPTNGRYIYASYLLMLFPTAFAGIVYSMKNKGYLGIVFCGLLFLISLIISMIVPSVTSSLLLVLTCLSVLTSAISRNWFNTRKLYSLLLVYFPVAAALALLFSSGALVRRITLAINPFIDPEGAGYIETITRQLLEGAKFIGQGTLPDGFQQIGVSHILPGINNEFLLTYIIHRFGWISFIIVVTILAIFIIRAFILCNKLKSFLGLLVSTAAILTLALQTVFYVAANLAFQLFTQLSLPFISQSSGYILVNLCLVGVLLSVFRTGYFIKDKGINKKETAGSFFKFEDGKLIIDFNIHYK